MEEWFGGSVTIEFVGQTSRGPSASLCWIMVSHPTSTGGKLFLLWSKQHLPGPILLCCLPIYNPLKDLGVSERLKHFRGL